MLYCSFRNKREVRSNGSHKVTISAFAQPYSILNEPYHKILSVIAVIGRKVKEQIKLFKIAITFFVCLGLKRTETNYGGFFLFLYKSLLFPICKF